MQHEVHRHLRRTIQSILFNRLSSTCESMPSAGPYRNVALLSSAQVRYFPDGTRMYSTVFTHQDESMRATMDLYGSDIERSICTFRTLGEHALTISNVGPNGLLDSFAFIDDERHTPLQYSQLKILRRIVLHGVLNSPEKSNIKFKTVE